MLVENEMRIPYAAYSKRETKAAAATATTTNIQKDGIQGDFFLCFFFS